MRITPIEIQQHQFKASLVGGYGKEGVDRFLEEIAEDIEQSNLESQQLRDEVARLRSALDEVRERESTLKETLITTQKVTDDLKANARREAELLIANAQLRAERIIQEAEERHQQVMAEIQELKRYKVAFETSLRVAIESHLRLLELGIDVGMAVPGAAPATPAAASIPKPAAAAPATAPASPAAEANDITSLSFF